MPLIKADLNQVVLFKNAMKKSSAHPDWRGTVNVDGQLREIELYIKKSKKGTVYYWGRVKEFIEENSISYTPVVKPEKKVVVKKKKVEPKKEKEAPFD